VEFRECMKKCIEECIEKWYKDAKPALEMFEWLRINTSTISCETYCEKQCRGGG
jgi:hypothetical protein